MKVRTPVTSYSARRCGFETTLGSEFQALAALPEAVKRLADNIQWTAVLGNAFRAQQGDVMDVVQRMRKKAQDKGTLKSTEQQQGTASRRFL